MAAYRTSSSLTRLSLQQSAFSSRILAQQFRPQVTELRRSSPCIATSSRRTYIAKATEYLPVYADYNESQTMVRESISKICADFSLEYWHDIDNKAVWPTEFQKAVADAGWLGIMMPSEYGGSELGLSEATVMMQTIAEGGGGQTSASSVHMNIFGLAPVIKYGTEEQKKRFLTPLIEGKERACFAVTEPNTGLDTLKLQSLATRDGDEYILKGSKIWTSTAQVAEKILILVRTKPVEECTKLTEGLTLFYTDMDRDQVSVTEIKKMGRAAVDTNSLYFDGWRVPVADRIGNEGDGFRQIMHGMNAERILIAGEAVGTGFAALRLAANYTKERVVFGRPIGKNQAIQHPLAKAWCNLEATRLMIMQAAKMWDEGFATGEYANSAKYLAGENAFAACETAQCSMGGMGYAKEYHVERLLREVVIPRLAPISREMCLNYIAEKVMDQPKSY
ncbi:acyl-CoA dehydrogenase, partial [Aureobasidium melanogenum]